MLYFIGYWDSGSNTYTRIDTSPVNYLTKNADIVATTATMVALTSYQISSDTTTSIAPSQTSFTNITPTYSSVIPSIEYYQAVTMSDVSYWLSTVTSYNMAELTTSNVAIDLT